MDNFLDKLKDIADSVQETEKCLNDWAARMVDDYPNYDSLMSAINSLGENARRMLEIGMIQDELVKLGFVVTNYNTLHWVGHNMYIKFNMHTVSINGEAIIGVASPTFREDVINRIKELINDGN